MTSLNDFKTIYKLGEGAFSIVYKGKHLYIYSFENLR